MRKTIATVILLFVTALCTFGQGTEIEIFINQVYKNIVPLNNEYYNLVDKSLITQFDKYSLEKDELDQLLKNYPDFPVSYFLQHGTDSSILNWRNCHLDKAKVYSIDSIPKFESQVRINKLVPFKTSKHKLDSLEKTKRYNEVIIQVKSSWSSKRRNKEIKLAWAKYLNNIRPEDRTYYRFSTPIFSDNKLYAIVTLSQSDRGATHIFKKVNNRWTEIFFFRRWAS